MDPLVVGSLGLIAIGVVASATVYLLSIRRAESQRQIGEIRRWNAVFLLSMISFMGVGPFVPWLMIPAFLGIGLALDSISHCTQTVDAEKKIQTHQVQN